MMQDQLFRVFPVQGVGSGIVIDSRGYILTNNHVIDGTDRLRVTFGDSIQVNAKVIGTDEETDLAVVRAELRDKNSNGKDEIKLQSANFGNSEQLKVGQIVIAIGNPFGLTGGPTVTAGIVSALNRNIQFENGILELIQTDAAINPGNSGGPLINTKGEVIGINTAKMPYAQGIGFAVPIKTAKAITRDLIENVQVTNRPWVGIATIKITRQLAQYYRLPTTEGALIALVEQNSPAYDAGLRKGDIIEAIDGKRVDDPSQISSNVCKKTVNDGVAMIVNRYGRRFEVQLKLRAQR